MWKDAALGAGVNQESEVRDSIEDIKQVDTRRQAAYLEPPAGSFPTQLHGGWQLRASQPNLAWKWHNCWR